MKNILYVVCLCGFGAGLPLPAHAVSSAMPDLSGALPVSRDSGFGVEAVVWVKDLGRCGDFLREHLALMPGLSQPIEGETAVERTGLERVQGWIDDLVTIMGVDPVPMAVTVWSEQRGVGVQMALHGAPGAIGRLEAFAATRRGWQVERHGKTATVHVDGTKLFVRQDTLGWLRVAPNAGMLLPGGGSPQTVFGEAAADIAESDGAFVIQGGRYLGALLGRVLAANPRLQKTVAGWQQLAATWTFGSDRSQAPSTRIRVAVDLPWVKEFEPLLGGEVRSTPLTWVSEGDATGLLSVALPQEAVGLLLKIAMSRLSLDKRPGVQGLAEATQELDGRIELVAFGFPQDWGLGLRFRNAAAAYRWARAAYRFLVSNEQKADDNTASKIRIETDQKGKRFVLNIRTDPAFEGLRLASLGDTVVVVTQAKRFQKLLETHDRAGGGGLSGARLLGDGITPLVKETLEAPALFNAYRVLGGDGALLGVLGWLGTFRLADPTDSDEEVPTWIGAWPSITRTVGFLYGLLYDVAVSVQIDAGKLILDVGMSEI